MGYRILVVEDDLTLRDWLRDFLRQEGHDAYALDRRSALKLFTARDLALDLLIVNLGATRGEHGREVVRAVKEFHPNVRALLISGGTTADELAHIARTIGADVALTKPFNLEELRAKIAELFPQGIPVGK